MMNLSDIHPDDIAAVEPPRMNLKDVDPDEVAHVAPPPGQESASPSEPPGLIGRTINSVKHMADGMSLPSSASDAIGRIAGGGFLRASPTEPVPGAKIDMDPSRAVGSGDLLGFPEGLLPELAAVEGAPFVHKLTRFLANAAVRTGANSAGAAVDAGGHVLSHGGDLSQAADAAGEAAGQTALIGGAGEAVSGLGSGIQSGMKSIGAGDPLKSLAEKKAFKAAVGNQTKAYNEAAERGVINARGREMLDRGTVGFGDSAHQIAKKASAEKAIAGQGIGDLLDSLDKKAPDGAVSGQSMASEIRAYANKIGGSGNKNVVSSLMDAADDLEKEGQMTFDRAQTHKDSWEWHPGSAVTHKVARAVKGIIGDEMESAVGRLDQPNITSASAPAVEAEAIRTGTDPLDLTGLTPPSDTRTTMGPQQGYNAAVEHVAPELSPAANEALSGAMANEIGPPPGEIQGPVNSQNMRDYQDLKSRYGTNAAAAKDAQITANRYDKNNAASLGDKAAAFAGAALNPHGTALKLATGAASGLANKLIRKRGASSLAVGMDRVGDLLNANPKAFGRFAAPLQAAAARGPQSLAVAHYMLSQQDPDYNKLMQEKP